MPSVSGAQHRFFGWAKSHPKESGVPVSVSSEYLSADKGKHFGHKRLSKKKAK
jgi:hypothetical protein